MASISTLTDPFTGGSMNATLWSSFGTLAWTSAHLDISNVANSSGYAGVTSNSTYDLTSSSIYVQLVSAGTQTIVSWQCALVLQQDTNDAIQFIVGDGTLVAQKLSGGAYTSLASTIYNSSTMQWLRVREASGTTYFDYSANGTSWTNFTSTADFLTLTALTVVVECGTYSTETLSTTGEWNNLNTPPSGTNVSFTNSFEGGTNGTTISTSNSGTSPDHAFDVVNVGTGDTVAFSKTHAAHGNFGGQVSTGSAGNPAYFGWNNSSLGTLTTIYGRAYLYLTALPSLVDNVVFFQSGSSQLLGIQINTNGTLELYNYAVSGAIHTFTSVIPTGQWVRIEWEVVFSTTVGQVTLSYYSPMDITTATETYTSAATLNLGASCNTVYFGWIAGKANQPAMYIDDIGISSSGLFGPAALTAALVSNALAINNFNGGTSGTTISTTNSAGISGTAFTTVSATNSAVAAFSNTQVAHGNLSAVVSTSATAGVASIQWGSAVVGTQTTLYGRAYFYLTAAPGTNDAVIEFQSTSGWAGGIQITTARVLLIQNQAFATVTTFASVIPTGQWVRVEWKLVSSATVGQIVLNYYATKDSVTPTQTYTSAATQNFGANCNAVWFGWNNSHASQPTTYIDDIALSTTGFLGPVIVPSTAFMTFFS
jgi:hypothetical protein